jgi:predicted  nucleic acid-binding Zn-ribbon protein
MLQALSEVRSENLDQAMARLREVEGALVAALDEVESESMQSTRMLQAKDGETSRMRAMVAANKAEISRMAIELDGARSQLEEAAKTADEAQVCSCESLWMTAHCFRAFCSFQQRDLCLDQRMRPF